MGWAGVDGLRSFRAPSIHHWKAEDWKEKKKREGACRTARPPIISGRAQKLNGTEPYSYGNVDLYTWGVGELWVM